MIPGVVVTKGDYLRSVQFIQCALHLNILAHFSFLLKFITLHVVRFLSYLLFSNQHFSLFNFKQKFYLRFSTMIAIKYLVVHSLMTSGVSRISFRGLKTFLEKWGYLHGVKRQAARGEATRLLGGFVGMLPRENFKNVAIWCVLENILLKFCKKNCKNIHFYIKIIDHVLVRTLYLGVLEHTPQISCQFCNLVSFGAHFP